LSDLLNPRVQDFINSHLSDDVHDLLLKGASVEGVSINLIVDQILSKRKAKSKLPNWFRQENILYPPPLSMEQCSSEETARYKASLFSGNRALDLTGGAGVDTYFLSKAFVLVDYVEKSEELTETAKGNFGVLDSNNIHIFNSSAKSFIAESQESYDLIYIDPSRRKDKAKVFQLQDCEPNIIDLQDELIKRAKNILIKTSPILDIKKTIKDLKNVERVIVLSLHNEVKEVLYQISSYDGLKEAEIVAVNLLKRGKLQEYIFSFAKEERLEIEKGIPEKGNFLYEPNASILKAGAFKSVTTKWKFQKLHNNTHLYTSAPFFPNFHGRVFKILEIFRSISEAKKKLKNQKLNIITRNYKLKPEEIKTKLGSRDGGNNYLIATTVADGSKNLYFCSQGRVAKN